jgi:hypoxanthine phosphoribosyltransferase
MIIKNKITLNERQLNNVIYNCVKDYITEMMDIHNTGVDSYITQYNPEGVGGKYYKNGVGSDNLMGIDGRTYMGNDKGNINLKPVSILKYELFMYLYNNFDKLQANDEIIKLLDNNSEKNKKILFNYCKKYIKGVIKENVLGDKFTVKDIDDLLNSDATLYQLAIILSKRCEKDSILTYINDLSKLVSARNNYIELRKDYDKRKVKEKDRLNYYKLKLPGTNIDVISLFNFNNFAGTEVIKANRISMASDEMSKLYNQPKKGFLPTTFKGTENNRSPFDFEFNDDFRGSIKDKNHINYGSAQHFIHDVMIHGVNVLNAINYVPDFLICVPSSSSFNSEFIDKFSKQIGTCKSYDAFMVKNWLGYSISDKDIETIKRHLSYLKYTAGEKAWDDTVNVMEHTIKRGIANSFLYLISEQMQKYLNINNYSEKQLNLILQFCFSQILEGPNGKQLSQFLKGSKPNQTTIKYKANFYIKNTTKNNKIFQYIYNKLNNKTTINKVIENIIKESERSMLQHLPNKQNESKPIYIDLNKIEYKDSEVQMTSLFWGGAMQKNSKTQSKLSGQTLRPLMVSVYLVNEQEYVLTKQGEELINELKMLENTQLNEVEKVEMANRKIMIFDDDMDTGASLKLCVNSLQKILNENNITNTSIKCLTMFNHIEFK